MRNRSLAVNAFSFFYAYRAWVSLLFLTVIGFMLLPTAKGADMVTPMQVQGYIAHADPAKALKDLAPILKADPHSAKAWYLQAEALDALGRDADAKTALSTAEHLSPGMPFANPKDLKGLEKRVGLQNVQSSRESSSLMKVFLGILLFVLLIGTVAFLLMRNESRKDAALVESERQDILLEITQFLTGELNSAKISADAQGNTEKLSHINEWHNSLVDAAQALKNVENDDTDSKKATIANARYLLEDVRNKLSGKSSATQVEMNPFYDANPFKNSGNVQIPTGTADVSVTPSQPAVYPVSNMGGNIGMNSGSGFGSALEQGLGMGIGLEIAEDLLGGGGDAFDNNFGNNGGDSFGGDFGSSGMDGNGFGGGTDSGFGGGDNFSGGTDDGFSGGDSFGGTDDGLSGGDDFGGGDDDGLDSGDDSW